MWSLAVIPMSWPVSVLSVPVGLPLFSAVGRCFSRFLFGRAVLDAPGGCPGVAGGLQVLLQAGRSGGSSADRICGLIALPLDLQYCGSLGAGLAVQVLPVLWLVPAILLQGRSGLGCHLVVLSQHMWLGVPLPVVRVLAVLLSFFLLPVLLPG